MSIILENIDERLVAALRKSVPMPYANKEILSGTDIVNELGVDSLGLLTLTVELENNFDVDISSNLEGLMAVVTVFDLQNYVQEIQG